jgi:hypothetical protein
MTAGRAQRSRAAAYTPNFFSKVHGVHVPHGLSTSQRLPWAQQHGERSRLFTIVYNMPMIPKSSDFMSMTCRETAGKDVTFFLLRPPSSHQMLLDHDHVINSSLSGRNILAIRRRSHLSLLQNWGVVGCAGLPPDSLLLFRWCWLHYIWYSSPHGELSPFVG